MAGKIVRPPSGRSPLGASAAAEGIVHDDAEVTNTEHTGVVSPKSVRTRDRAGLMGIAGSVAGKVFRMNAERISIGRSKQADIALSDQGVSRMHCAILRHGDTFVLEDLASTNGTLVNGTKLGHAEIRPGDRIQIGREAVLQFGFFDEAEEGLANQLYEAATRDPLTRALNRRAFDERLVAEVSYASRHKEGLVAILLDIDHFKAVNDSYGHGVGDQVITELAKALATTLRNEDIFARYGGEEFVILARGLNLKSGIRLAERVRHLAERLVFTCGDTKFRATLSCGVAELGENGHDANGAALLQLADERLYTAKRLGRNRVVGK